VPERQCVIEGTCYPTNHVGAVIDQRAEAEDAAADLQGAGFEDVVLFHGREAYEAIRDASGRNNALTRAWRRLRDHGDEGELHEHFLSTLRRGRSFVIVYADTPEQVAHARDILASRHAHDIWYLGAWAMERMLDGLPEAQLEQQPEQYVG
jgi:hypothetical protein